jgi:hypothetical protein
MVVKHHPPPAPEPTYPTEFLCKRWHCDPRAVRRLARAARATGMKAGRCRVYTQSEIDRMEAVARARSEPAQEAKEPAAAPKAAVDEATRRRRSAAARVQSRRLGESERARLAPRAEQSGPGQVIAFGLSK